MKITILESPDLNLYDSSLVDVIQEFGRHEVTRADTVDKLDSSCDLLVLVTLQQAGRESRVLSQSGDGRKIRDFVAAGGFCWITQQMCSDLNLAWLPPHLDYISFSYRHLPTIFRIGEDQDDFYNYLCPWIVRNDHPFWHKPNRIEEAHFLNWKVKINQRCYRTAATHILRQKGWQVLAGYADHEIRLKENTTLVMEGKHGLGNYLWTEIFPPQAFWKDCGSPGQKTWRLLLENLLTYVNDYRRNQVLSAGVIPTPWSVKIGDKIGFSVKCPAAVASVSFDIFGSNGFSEKLSFLKKDVLREKCFYRPAAAGSYEVKALVKTEDERYTYSHTSFKVVDEKTPLRFYVHSHFSNIFQPASLATLRGVARLTGADAVVLAAVGTTKKGCQEIDPVELQAADSPQVRFFPGQELHPQQRYGVAEGALPGNKKLYGRRHCLAIGSAGVKYNPWQWESKNLTAIHKKGLAVVCHPGLDPWFISKQNGEYFEAVELDEPDRLFLWDKALKQGLNLTGLRAWDNTHLLYILKPSVPNVGIFDQPLNSNSLMRVILKGSITNIAISPDEMLNPEYRLKLKNSKPGGKKPGREPNPFQAGNDRLDFRLYGQVIGGTVFAVDGVLIEIDARCYGVVEELRLVKNGERAYRKIKGGSASISKVINEKINRNCYFRIEASCKDGESFWEYLTNPIYVHKIPGPPAGYFYFTNQAGSSYDPKAGRWSINPTRLEKVSFNNGCWQIDFFEPGRGIMGISHLYGARVFLDGKMLPRPKTDEAGNFPLSFSGGRHRVEVKYGTLFSAR